MGNETAGSDSMDLVVLYSDLKRFAFLYPILIFKTTGVKALVYKTFKQK